MSIRDFEREFFTIDAVATKRKNSVKTVSNLLFVFFICPAQIKFEPIIHTPTVSIADCELWLSIMIAKPSACPNRQ